MVGGTNIGPAGNLSRGVDGIAATLLAAGQSAQVFQPAALAPEEGVRKAICQIGLSRHLAGNIDRITDAVGTAQISEVDHAAALGPQERLIGRTCRRICLPYDLSRWIDSEGRAVVSSQRTQIFFPTCLAP